MSNIAEGFERDGNREFVNFLSVAKGSIGEVRAQLYIARDQEYISDRDFDHAKKLVIETGNTIGGLMKYLKQSEFKGKKFING